ncbi:MAG: type II toxin-antitoxin system PemK/MazF family toxin [Candidatus Atribacteria bacterium]|nr:type II toxin-antitoxin system PemK/MazF family toxin [Candidatus Atribacteria bacterium]
MNCSRGDVILVRFPNSDFITYKKRPALVVQADIETGLSQKIVALITSNLGRTGPTRVYVPKNSDLGKQMGLKTDSVIVVDNLATVLEREMDKRIGKCTEWFPVADALLKTFGLEKEVLLPNS